ncbi:Atrial natriuretic peptide-converting enzyme [Microtus ochrogaster]|uniref:Atrial natriuretic peptide-converting enzyme n=1 Tax=Microtus ochrogaster TaxID=79684 RepID=A0A8J6H250_MICOH|nr:Atrial natriuretic peptide-converting enzyme [Microtus ochrogaster]
MGKVFFSVPVNSVRRARCSCPGRCYLSCRIPPTAALQAPSGLGCARVPGKAAGGAVGSGPSGTGGFLSGPTFQAPGSWKDSVGAPPAPDVLRADSGVGEGYPQKLVPANLLRFLLLALIPCICALIVLLAILLSFVGTLKKVYFKSNASEPVVTDDEVQVSGVFLVTTVYNKSAGAPATPPSQFTPAWTPRDPPHSGDQSHRNASACKVLTHSQCQILPYHSTMAPLLPIVKTMDMEKFLKFLMYLHRLSCYQHILLFGCSLAFPECIIDGDDSDGKWKISDCLCMFPDWCCDHFPIILSLSLIPMALITLCGGGESFQCTSGLCIPEKLRCNGYNDCDDWSDEALCNCSGDLFHCHTGKCLSHSLVCDGYDDCGDLSDEQNCDCNLTKEHRCGDGRCIAAEWVCDGDLDCVDKSDEINCSCHSQGLVECRSGQCIPSSFRCDGDEDCQDGSDEESCGDRQTPCPEGDEGCLDNSCLDTCAGSSACDSDGGLRNCSCKERDLWECPANKQCLKHTLICDGFPDCPDSMDEKNCSFCQDDELECVNHECVPRDLWCDGRVDCSDSSDEWDCVTLSKNGSSSSFLAVHRSATEHHVCADGWQEALSQLACRQMGLGEHAVTELIQGQESQPWLRLHSNWENLNGTTLQELLVHRREDADVWKVVFGINNLDHPSAFVQTRFVKNILLHPRYNRAVVDYDISIVELSDDINETSYVRPVCLPSPEEYLEPDTYCYITGWGHMGNKMPFKLQEGEVRIIPLERCQSYFDMKTITSRMICAGYEAGTVDSCMGDSGGPLVCERPGGQWTLFGLTSWGSVCFSKVLGPGVYSNVSYFVEWIERQMYIKTFLQKEFQG